MLDLLDKSAWRTVCPRVERLAFLVTVFDTAVACAVEVSIENKRQEFIELQLRLIAVWQLIRIYRVSFRGLGFGQVNSSKRLP